METYSTCLAPSRSHTHTHSLVVAHLLLSAERHDHFFGTSSTINQHYGYMPRGEDNTSNWTRSVRTLRHYTGLVLRAVASTGGGPGSRWPLLQAYRKCARSLDASRGSQRQADLRNVVGLRRPSLPNGDTPRTPPAEVTPQHSSYQHLRYTYATPRAEHELTPSGYQRRGAHGGTQRGRCSEEAQNSSIQSLASASMRSAPGL